MTYPTIRHLDDVLPHIAGRTEFVHAQRDGYSFIDYNFALPDSFDDPMRLECRGIKFAPDGSIMARPFQKFFNIGERPDTQPHVLDFSQPHVVTEKLDGSMIHPAIVNGEVVFMTRAGRTDVALKAERHLDVRMQTAIQGMLLAGWTPIFEFTAPDNRIVVKYDDSRITLLAMRATKDGGYMGDDMLQRSAAALQVPAVPLRYSDWSSSQAFADYAHAVTGMEGFVVRFDSGLWVKAKGDDYVLKHRAQDSITHEKNVLALVLSGGLDDVLPLLDPSDHMEIAEYQVKVILGIEQTAAVIRAFVAANDNLDQKSFALNAVPTLPPILRPIAYLVRNGAGASDVVREALKRTTGTQQAVNASRPLHGATWPI